MKFQKQARHCETRQTLFLETKYPWPWYSLPYVRHGPNAPWAWSLHLPVYLPPRLSPRPWFDYNSHISTIQPLYCRLSVSPTSSPTAIHTRLFILPLIPSVVSVFQPRCGHYTRSVPSLHFHQPRVHSSPFRPVTCTQFSFHPFISLSIIPLYRPAALSIRFFLVSDSFFFCVELQKSHLKWIRSKVVVTDGS